MKMMMYIASILLIGFLVLSRNFKCPKESIVNKGYEIDPGGIRTLNTMRVSVNENNLMSIPAGSIIKVGRAKGSGLIDVLYNGKFGSINVKGFLDSIDFGEN